MTKSAQRRGGIFGFFGTLLLSAGLMLWMLWHFPVSTSIATVAVLAAFAISARLAGSIDSDSLSDSRHGERSA